ncbi:MAG: DegT/DnrJ/EryC1/StrS family aminotransferase [Clostridia bacterium]|nr:DegT/DnrJ/EryC1/StrS family aminotransferase [Clostridia bacterium]
MKQIQVTKPSLPPFEEYAEEIKKIWENYRLTNFGPIEEQLREELENFLGAEHLVLFTNGHQALEAALKVIVERRKREKNEIITTPFTFASTTHAIAGSGFTPVFADIDPVTYTLDPEKVEKLIGPGTRAIVPVHVYGTVCDTEAFDRISRKYNIPVIYDAAHAFGVRTKDGRGAGTFGTASMFSFHATKAFNTVEGGAVAVKDAETAARLRQFCNFGLGDGGDAEIAGTNAKMTEFAAAMGVCNLRHIEEVIKKREKICKTYTELLTEGDNGFDPATGISGKYGIKLLPKQEGIVPNYAYFPVVLPGSNKAELAAEKLAAENIFARRYFFPLTSDFSCYSHLKHGRTPVADRISANVLSLPLYADMTGEDVVRVTRVLRRIIR